MKEIEKKVKAWVVVDRGYRNPILFYGEKVETFAVHFSKEDAMQTALDEGDSVVLPCTITYKTPVVEL